MIEPLGMRLLVKRDETAKETASGFIIPDEAQKKELTGTVFAIGPEVKDVKVNDRVIFGKVDGVNIKSEYVGSDGDFIMLREDQIKAIYV